MYLTALKSAVVEALRKTFGPEYPEPDMRNLHVSIEYPDTPQAYPGVWINYEDTGPLERAGIDHREIVIDSSGSHEVTRWRFSGSLSFTVAAFSSFERDRLYDEMVRVLAFASVDQTNASTFKAIMENNDFLGINVQYDVLQPSGDAASPGTPWGSTDETIYEKTLSADVIGEFVSDPSTSNLVLLSEIQVEGYRDGEPVPDFPDIVGNGSGVPFDPSSWH
jgi:hypothetical protein